MLASENNSKPYKLKNYKQTTSNHCRHHNDQQKAIQDKIDSFIKNNTQSLPTFPSSSGKWVYKKKCKPTNNILQFKARYIVKGYSQCKSIDYNETFASIIKPISYKAIFAVCIS